jgi:hypothetical protein
VQAARAELEVGDVVSAGQVKHVVAAVEVEYFPETQLMHVAELVALTVVEYFPCTHFKHGVVPRALTEYCPGKHLHVLARTQEPANPAP